MLLEDLVILVFGETHCYYGSSLPFSREMLLYYIFWDVVHTVCFNNVSVTPALLLSFVLALYSLSKCLSLFMHGASSVCDMVASLYSDITRGMHGKNSQLF